MALILFDTRAARIVFAGLPQQIPAQKICATIFLLKRDSEGQPPVSATSYRCLLWKKPRIESLQFVLSNLEIRRGAVVGAGHQMVGLPGHNDCE